MTQKNYKYFAISESDKTWGIYLLNIGSQMFAPNQEYPAKDHPAHHYFQWNNGRVLQEYQLFYLLEGDGEFESEKSGKQNISAGQVVFLFPGVWHRYRPKKNSPWRTYWIGFDGQFARHVMDTGFVVPVRPVIDMGYHERIVRLFQEIEHIGNEEWAGYQQIMAGLLIQLLGEIHARQRRQPFQHSGHEDMIRHAKILFLQTLDQSIQMDHIAGQLGVGYSLFRRLFKQYTGMSPRQYVIQLRIEKAKDLLLDRRNNVKEVAYLVGFESNHYFTRLFKEKTGLTPTQFINQSLKKID